MKIEKFMCVEDQLLDFAGMETGFEIQDVVIYCLAIVDGFRDWRTGTIDDWDFVFVRLQE